MASGSSHEVGDGDGGDEGCSELKGSAFLVVLAVSSCNTFKGFYLSDLEGTTFMISDTSWMQSFSFFSSGWLTSTTKSNFSSSCPSSSTSTSSSSSSCSGVSNT